MGETIKTRNMANTVFQDVNLNHSHFEDVNLQDAVFCEVNLSGVRIDDANIAGLTILGVRVDEWIRAELARRDPDAATLCAFDPHDPACIHALLRRLDQERHRFKEHLRAADECALNRRPGKGRWSALEHLRHLVLAEELYTHRWILRDTAPLSPLGLLPRFLVGRPGFEIVGTDGTENLAAVLQAWDQVHRLTLAFVARVTADQLKRSTADVDFGQGTVGGVLAGMAHHDRHHVRRAQSALEAAQTWLKTRT